MKKLSFKKKVLIALGAGFLACAGCIEVDPLVQGGSDGTLSTVTNFTYHGSAYRSTPWIGRWTGGGDLVHPLASVRPKYNWWYAFLATCSFGLYMPIDLEWRYDLGEGGVK